MPFDPRRRRPLVFTLPARLDPDGVTGPTRHQARRGKWRRVGTGLYVPSEVDPTTPEQRAVEQAARYPASAISGWGRCGCTELASSTAWHLMAGRHCRWWLPSAGAAAAALPTR